MKKYTIVILLIICMVFALTSCILPNDDTGGNGTIDIDKDKDVVPTFIDISNLNYNPNYNNPTNPKEKGFVLYDAMNLNTITYTRTLKKSADFEIYYGEKLEKEIRKSPQGTTYSNYTFKKTGLYTVKVNASGAAASGGVLTNTFEVAVRANGYPNKVEFEIRSSDSREKVTETKAGESYILSARVYSDDILIEKDTEKFESYWYLGEQGTLGKRTVDIALGNVKKDKQEAFIFQYKCANNYIESKSCIVSVKNNYEKIEVIYDLLYVTNGKANVSVLEDNVVADGDFNFFNFVSAQHKYTNGDTEKITINFSSNTNIEGEIVPFIKYNGEELFLRYIRGEGFDDCITYQFNPRKDSAEVYLAICSFEQFDGGLRPIYTEIDSSQVVVTFIKEQPNIIRLYICMDY